MNGSDVIPANGAAEGGEVPRILCWIPDLRSPAAYLSGMTAWMEVVLAAQKENLILWVPIILACGIGAYFGLTFEPPPALTMGIAALSFLALLISWPLKERTFPLWAAGVTVFLFIAGFALAQARTVHLASPMLEKEIKITKVTGTIATLEDMEEGAGQRYILTDLSIEKLPPEKTPKNIRLRVRTGKNQELKAGDRVEVLAGLNPPSPPVAPGAFDFQRYAYFRQIGAFGYTYETPRIVAQRPPESFAVKLEQFRENMIARINRALPDASQSSIAIAMMTGERAAISQTDNDDLQASGLAHMLSISGMHIGMVTAMIFFSIRFLLAAVPFVALRLPIKKYAAFLALAGITAYVVVIGMDNVPAVRSLLMTALVLVALMLDRMPFSLRTVGAAALVVLTIWPDALWTASFQMSFAAVAALIWFFEVTKDFWTRLHRDAGLFRKLALYVAGLCLTSLVAGAATAPFVLYHFQRVSVYGMLANLLGVPVLGFAVMPAVVVSYVLMPFGWEYPALWVMGQGIAVIMEISRDVAAMPGANIYLPALPLSVFVWMTAAALIVMLWRGKGKWFAILPLLVSIVIAVNARQPDILISSEGKLIAYTPAGDERIMMTVSSRTHERFVAGVWMQRYGLPPDYKPEAWPKEGAGTGGVVCGEGGCRLEAGGRKIAFSYEPFAHSEDCAWADIMIADDPVRQGCKSGTVIDFFDLRRYGAHALWLDGTIRTVAEKRGKRPWTTASGEKKR